MAPLYSPEDFAEASRNPDALTVPELRVLLIWNFVSRFYGINGYEEEGPFLYLFPLEVEPAPDFTIEHWKEGVLMDLGWDYEGSLNWMLGGV